MYVEMHAMVLFFVYCFQTHGNSKVQSTNEGIMDDGNGLCDKA